MYEGTDRCDRALGLPPIKQFHQHPKVRDGDVRTDSGQHLGMMISCQNRDR